MKRTTISLPDELALLAAREGRRQGASVSEVVRVALQEHLGIATEVPRPLPFAALGRSQHRHTARQMEEILERQWANNPDRKRR